MRILTWNLGYWQYSSQHDKAWDYLCNNIKPDIALLQEVKPPSWVPRRTLVFEEITKGWGTSIYTPSLPLSREHSSLYPGRVALASTMLGGDGDSPLLIASIHAPIINGRVFPHLGNIFAEVESKRYTRSAIIGGDLNSARLCEKVWPGYGHGPFFERIDSGDPWIDCCRRFNSAEIQTFFRDTCVHPFQDDHIFVSRDLSDCLRSCNVVKNDLTRSVSDHIPLIAELDLSCANTGV
jgi:endonuclease/exonuclease/phosphatase family metal-dependent hydrolase